MKLRLIFWPAVMAYAAFLTVESTAHLPQTVPIFGSALGAVAGIAIALAFYGRAKRKTQREPWRHLTRY